LEHLFESEHQVKEELSKRLAEHDETTRRLVSMAHEVLQTCLASETSTRQLPAQQQSGAANLPAHGMQQLEDILGSIATEVAKRQSAPRSTESPQQGGSKQKGKGRAGNEAADKQLQIRPSSSSDNLSDTSDPSELSAANLQARLRALSDRDPEMFLLFRQLAQQKSSIPIQQPAPPWMSNHPYKRGPGGVVLYDPEEPPTPPQNQVISAKLNGPFGHAPQAAKYTDPTAGWNRLQGR
jgi:hypothetical protein